VTVELLELHMVRFK